MLRSLNAARLQRRTAARSSPPASPHRSPATSPAKRMCLDGSASASTSTSASTLAQPPVAEVQPSRSAPGLGGWVRMPAAFAGDEVATLGWVALNQPSSFDQRTTAWVWVGPPPAAAPAAAPATTSPSGKTATGANTTGKWMLFLPHNSVDEVFAKMAGALARGELGSGLKTPPAVPGAGGVSVLIVYTADYTDRADVLRVAQRLQQLLDLSWTISYKPDVFTLADELGGGSGSAATDGFKTIYQVGGKGGWDRLRVNEPALAVAKKLTFGE